MSLPLLTFLILLLSPYSTLAVELVGEGHGLTRENAKQEALSDLSQSIATEVKSVHTGWKGLLDGKYSEDATQMVRVESRLPLLGLETHVLRGVDEWDATSFLRSERAAHLYREKLIQLQQEIEQTWSLVKLTERNAELEPLLQQTLTKLEDFKRHLTVTLALGERENLPELNIDEAEVQGLLWQAQEQPDSMEQAARLLTKEMQQYSSVYVFPMKVSKTQEITPFALAFQGRLQQELNTVLSPDQAKYWLHGNYVVGDEGMEITLHISKAQSHSIELTRSTFLVATAYAGLSAQPSQPVFDKLLREDVDVWLASDFRVSIKTDRGREQLHFSEGDSFELQVKLNKPGYFYIVGHTFMTDVPLSYLVEINSGIQNSPKRFVRHVTVVETGEWINLGRFAVRPPLGRETLQLIAARENLSQFLPDTNQDLETQLYIIDSDPVVALGKTRSLLQSDKLQGYSAEAELTYTTWPR